MNTMSTTYSEIEDGLSFLAGPDASWERSASAGRLRHIIAKVVEREASAAVAAETERCAVIGDQLARYFDQYPGVKDKAAAESCRQYAAAIRAGNGSAAK